MTEITEEQEKQFKAELAQVNEELKKQGNVIKEMKTKKASRKELMPEVTKLNELKAKVATIQNKLFPPSKLDVDRKGLEELLKRRFFYTQSWAIYNGKAGLYDMGPPCAAIKANLLQLWREFFILEDSMLEIDTTVLTPTRVLEVSQHVAKFKDFMVKDLKLGGCYRADHLLEEHMDKLMEAKNVTAEQKREYQNVKEAADNYTPEQLHEQLQKYKVKSPLKNDISKPFPFNLMFETPIGAEGNDNVFLRPETAQGIFCNFAKLLEYNNQKMPFAGATIGQAFRNEIAPRQGLLRVREFTLAEIEHFVDPEYKDHEKFESIADRVIDCYTKTSQSDDGDKRILKISLREAVNKGIICNQTVAYFLGRIDMFMQMIGIKKWRFRQHKDKEMAHYASDCWDCEILTTYGWVECVGVADRECFDLSCHSKASNNTLGFFRPFPDGTRKIPTVKVECSKQNIGKAFKKEAKVVIEYLTKHCADKQNALALKAKLEAGNHTVEVGDKQYELSKNMISIEEVEVEQSGETIIPSVIEPAFGIGRIIYCLLESAYYVRPEDTKRGVLKLKPVIAPVKCSVLPLLSDAKLMPKVKEIAKKLSRANISHRVDSVGKTIGRRYARTDEIGIPFGITIDYDTLSDDTVTLRERDSTKQIRIPINSLCSELLDLVQGQTVWADLFAKYPEHKAVEKDS